MRLDPFVDIPAVAPNLRANAERLAFGYTVPAVARHAR